MGCRWKLMLIPIFSTRRQFESKESTAVSLAPKALLPDFFFLSTVLSHRVFPVPPAPSNMSLPIECIASARRGLNRVSLRGANVGGKLRESAKPSIARRAPSSSFSRRSYCTIHPTHKEPVHLPTKEEEDASTPKRPERAVNIIGLTRQELEEEFVHFGLDKYRAAQVFQWLYGQGVTSFEDMPNLGKKLIASLNERYYIDSGSTAADSTSNDGTRKWLVDLGEKQCVEST